MYGCYKKHFAWLNLTMLRCSVPCEANLHFAPSLFIELIIVHDEGDAVAVDAVTGEGARCAYEEP